MKRVRSEQLQALVLTHLKKRNYTDTEANFKASFKFDEDIKAMSHRVSQTRDMSTKNSTSLSSFTLDEYFTSFVRVGVLVRQLLTEKIATDIKDLLFPIFAYLYMDLLLSGRDDDANVFYQKFACDANLKSVETNLLLEELASVSSKSTLNNSPKLLQLLSKKYVVELTEDSREVLLRFLHEQENLILLKIVNQHIALAVPSDGSSFFDLFASDITNSAKSEKPNLDSSKFKDVKMDVTMPEKIPEPLLPPSLLSPATNASVDPNANLFPEVDVSTWRNCVKEVAESKPTLSNICVYRFSDISNGLTHATFSNGFQSISTGFEDSSVRIWNTQRHSFDDFKSDPTFKYAKGSPEKGRIKHENSTSLTSTSTQTDFYDTTPDVSKVLLGCDSWDKAKKRISVNTYCPNLNFNIYNQQCTSQNCQVHTRKCTTLRGHSGPVYSSTFTHDDKFVLSTSRDCTVRLWDTLSCKNKAIFRGHNYPVWCVSSSALSMYFATSSLDRTARLWSLDRTFPLRIFAGHSSSVGCVSFHGNCMYLATADNRTIRLWDIASGKTVRLMTGHWASVLCLAFSPNGKYLASSGEDRKIRMWDIASGALIKEMRGHSSSVLSLDFSPDDSMLASCGLDGCLRVWNTRTSLATPTRNNTDVDDPDLNPDLIARWRFDKGDVLHNVTFQSCNILNCVNVTS